MNIILISCLMISFTQDMEVKPILTVEISGFANNDGMARIALANSEKDWDSSDSSFKSEVCIIENKKVSVTFNDLPKGKYAVKVFHDENNNGDLDKSFFMQPKEAYGFSNNARGTFGPASWEDAQFELSSDITIQITVK